MKKRSLKIMSVVLAGGMTTGMMFCRRRQGKRRKQRGV